jgi:PQQ-dependent dehydrogenase (methanol/ethanol family)
MRHLLRWTIAAAAVALLVRPVPVRVQSDPRMPAGKDWPSLMGDLGNMRYSPLTQINAETVSRLGAAWMSPRLTPPANARAMSVVQNGMMFFSAPPNIYKINLKTGDTVWKFDTSGGRGGAGRGRGGARGAGGGEGEGGAPAMGAPNREGVVVADGLVFSGLSDSRVIALNEATGELVWNQYVGDKARDKGQVISAAPVYAGGIVSVGLSADNGWRGQVVGLDAKTGREFWRWFAVPAPGEPGSESWPKTAQWKFGGGAVWLVGAADPDAGLVFYVTGNGVPQLSGEFRAGDNHYLCSIVALDMKTGKLKWHFQTIRHDIWEADMSVAPVLFEAQVDGRMRKAVAGIRPDGYLFIVDRETGKPLQKIEDRAVPQDAFQKTAGKQPYPVGFESPLNDCDWWRKQRIPAGFEVGCYYTAVSTDKPNMLFPYYGMRVAPMSYSPQTGYFYAVGERSLRWLRRSEDPYFFSTSFSNRVPGINELTMGVIGAIDSRTGKLAWKKEFKLGAGRPAGTLATAGGLVFHTTPDGNFNAYDARTGNTVWQFQTGSTAG